MDRETRNRIQRATQDARALLEREYAEQLAGTFDIFLDGTIATTPGGHLDAGQRLIRAKLVTAVASAPRASAAMTFASRYAVGRSGVRRSWRLQPLARSIDTEAPALVVAMIAP